MEKLLSTNDVAERLGVTIARVQALIWDERLPAMKIGRTYIIKESDLALVSDRKAGRPKKEDAAEDVPAATSSSTSSSRPKSAKSLTDAEKKRIRDAQQARWLASAPGKKATKKKGGKK